MLEKDIIFDDILDIDGSSLAGRGLALTYDLLAGTWSGNDTTGIANGELDGTQNTDDNDGILGYSIEVCPIPSSRTYSWLFDGQSFQVLLDISAKDYYDYKSSPVSRGYLSDIQKASFITYQDPIVMDLANRLSVIADGRGYSALEKANLILSFVTHIKYSFDNESAGRDEYWRFPVETLYDENGDCEDTSILYASLMEALGYDAILVEPPGHLAVGLACPGAHGTYYSFESKEYFICETTGENYYWSVGEMPPSYRGVSPDLIQVP
jgi:hypothetical protein